MIDNPQTPDPTPESACKFEEGCHRVAACDPGCATTRASDPAQAVLRDSIADAIARVDCGQWGTEVPPQEHPFWQNVYLAYADAVMAVLPAVPVPPATHAADRAALRDRTAEAVHRAMHPSRSWTRQSDEIREQCFQVADEVLGELPPSASQDSASADEVAHALDNATPYPIELDSALCRFMAERLLEMLAIAKRTEHAVWHPDEEPPPGPQPQPEDPSNLPDEEASRG